MSGKCKVNNVPTTFEDVEIGVKGVRMLVPYTNSLANPRAKLHHSWHGGVS
jgi:ABC-type antimicrobial peptide transport system ATPase subunit